MEFAQWLRDKRTEYQISQQRLAVESGCSRRYISVIETDNYCPSEKMQAAIVTTLKLLNPNKGLELVFEYARLRFDTPDINHVIERILKIKTQMC